MGEKEGGNERKESKDGVKKILMNEEESKKAQLEVKNKKGLREAVTTDGNKNG
jgi:hypothetical protein